jgi:hypothetical protein
LSCHTRTALPLPRSPSSRLTRGVIGSVIVVARAVLEVGIALLTLADSNIAALQARALALSALAAATADPAQAGQAAQAFARARTALSAAGVAEDTQRLLTTIASHDQSGVLAIIRTPPDL